MRDLTGKIIALLLISMPLICLQAQQANPLLIHSNSPIPFDKVNADVIQQAVDSVIAISDRRVNKIAQILPSQRTTANTLIATDELSYDLLDLAFKCGLIAGTYANNQTRNAANDASNRLGNYLATLFLNGDLYQALKGFASTLEANKLTEPQAKFLRESILLFEKNGMKLNVDKREELREINRKITALGLAFDKNIAESKDSLSFSEKDLVGVPETVKKPWARSGGKYIVYINGPNSRNLLRYADHETTRRKMYLAFNNRAYPENIQVLDSLLLYRSMLAKKLGFQSYAAYSVVDKMSGSPQEVWKFEKDLIERLKPLASSDVAQLRELKQKLNPELSDTLYDYDLSYYSKKLLDARYQLDTDEVRQYFEMNNTLKGMFALYERILGIRIVETQPKLAAWDPNVKTYELFKDGVKTGTFYLDLFPRPNKYTHFACFPISQYKKTGKREVLPVAALICNFPQGTTDEPSLLYHSDVITLFHEFGHLVHAMLGRSELASQGPFSVKGDFVEAPSQLLENWCWEYDALKTFARHYKTGKTLPPALYEKMKNSKLALTGLNNMRQLYFGTIDFTFHDKYDSINSKSLTSVSKSLTDMVQIPYVEGSHLICSFGHLNGYAANYYGYMWSRVFAEDMFSVFKKEGVMNSRTGIRYRQQVLEKGSTMDEIEMLKNFLGRSPNSNAFMQSLGLKPSYTLDNTKK